MTGRRFSALALCLCAAACGGRNESLGVNFSDDESLGLRHAVVLGDNPLERVVVVQSDGLDSLHTRALPVGQNRVSMLPDVSGERLLVLSGGRQPRLEADDELPSLTLIDTLGEPKVEARYELSAPFSALTQDPRGKWVVLSGAAGNLVTNLAAGISDQPLSHEEVMESGQAAAERCAKLLAAVVATI